MSVAISILLILVSWAETVEYIGRLQLSLDFEAVRMPDFYSDEELEMLQPALDGTTTHCTFRGPPETEHNSLGLYLWAL